MPLESHPTFNEEGGTDKSGIFVDFDRLLINSFIYTKDAFLGKQSRWILFIISKYLLYPLFLGYMVEILPGEDAIPVREPL